MLDLIWVLTLIADDGTMLVESYKRWKQKSSSLC